MLSTSKNFLFVHVPKTGGNSLQNILRKYSEDSIVTSAAHQDGVERFEIANEAYGYSKHSSLAEYRKVLGEERYRSLFKFAVIRNPWDRVVSFYFSPHRGGVEWNQSDFKSFLKTVPPVRRYIGRESRLSAALGRIGFSRDFLGRNGFASELDCILRFENLQADFDGVCDQLGLAKEILPKRNASEREHYSRYYDSESVEMVEKLFYDEIEYGGYSFSAG